MKTLTKTTEVAEFIKKFIIPIIAFLVGVGMMWATLDNRIISNAMASTKNTRDIDYLKDSQNLMLQRLSSIDTKLEFIIQQLQALERDH